MLIYIEDYRNRRQARAHVRPLLLTAGGTTATLTAQVRVPARALARVHVLPLGAPCRNRASPSALELDGIYAEATLL